MENLFQLVHFAYKMVSVKGPLNFYPVTMVSFWHWKRLPCHCRRICFLSLYFVFCICSKRSVGGGSVLRLHQRHHRLQAAGGFWQVAQLSSQLFQNCNLPNFSRNYFTAERGSARRRAMAGKDRCWVGLCWGFDPCAPWCGLELGSTGRVARVCSPFHSPCAVNYVCLIYLSSVPFSEYYY